VNVFDLYPTKDNIVQWGVLSEKGQICTGGCSRNENIDHLFVTYEFMVICGQWYPGC